MITVVRSEQDLIDLLNEEDSFADLRYILHGRAYYYFYYDDEKMGGVAYLIVEPTKENVLLLKMQTKDLLKMGVLNGP